MHPQLSKNQATPDTLQLTLLGFPQVTLGGKPVVFVRRAAMALLAYLAVSPRPHSRDVLATLLSGEVPEARARTLLRNALNELSGQIGPYIVVTRQTVSLNLDQPLAIDTADLEEALRVARATGETTALQAAVERCQHEFLEGFALRDAPLFDEWLLMERERVNTILVQALDLLSQACIRRGNDATGLMYARRLLAIEPWRAETQHHMVELAARSGKRGAAQHVIPVTGAFVGRRGELKTLAAWLEDSGCRLITITGVGGCGKTCLALQAAARYSESFGSVLFPDGVFYVALDHIAAAPDQATESARRLLRAIARALGVTLEEHTNLADQVATALESRAALLIIDNIEHLRDGVAVLERLLRIAPTLTVLVTSRVQLALEDASTLALEPMELPHSADDLERADAGVLFLQQARQSRATFEPDQAQRAAIVRICRLVEGLPLGIVLAARLVRALECSDIAARLSAGTGWLAASTPDLPERHQSLAANFAYSWALLAETEQQTLRQLSVFEGTFSAAAAAAVTSAPATRLHSLSGAGMLAAADDRFRVSGLLRPHIALRCQQAGEEPEARLRHATYYTKMMTQSLPGLVRHTREQHAIERDLPNIQAAWAWMLSQVAG